MSEKAPDGEGAKWMTGLLDPIAKFIRDMGPLQSLAIVAVVLIVAGALGGLSLSKIQNMDPEHSTRAMEVGATLAFVFVLIYFGTHSKNLTLLFLALAAIMALVVVAVFLDLIPWPKAERVHETTDIIIILLAAAGWFGIVPAYLTSRFVNGLPDTVNAHLAALQKKEDELVNHVEDATRSLLKGFPEIFEKALALIRESKADRELIFVNFALNFGHPHIVNDDIVKQYKKLTGNIFEDDVAIFLNELRARIPTIPEVKILTVSKDGAREQFLLPLKNRPRPEGGGDFPYGKLDVDKELQASQLAKRQVKALIDDSTPSKGILETDSIPIQILIIGLPSRTAGGDKRVGCLVFMVGSEIIKGLTTGEEAGFYTELPSMVTVFRNLANGLIRDAESQRKARQARKDE